MSYGALFISKALIHKTISSLQHSGSFVGVRVSSENIYAAIAASGETGDLSEASERVLNCISLNRAVGKREYVSIKWCIVQPQVIKEFGIRAFDLEEFEQAFHYPKLDLGVPEYCFCVIDEKSQHAIGFVAKHAGGKIYSRRLDAIILDDIPDSLKRLPIQDRSILQSSSAIIVGTGSGGGEIAFNLAAAGVGKLTLIDNDRVHPENYFRSNFDFRDLGRQKVIALAERIKEHELPTAVIPYSIDVLWEADTFRDLLGQDPGLVICATDSVRSRRFVNYCCIKLNRTLIIGGTLRGGQIGETMTIKPYQGPCYECIRLALRDVLEQVDAEEYSAYMGFEEQSIGSSALRSDVSTVAAFVARAALSELDSFQFSPLRATYFVFGREAQKDLSYPFGFPYSLSSTYLEITRNLDCEVCGSPPPELANRNIESEAKKILDNIQ